LPSLLLDRRACQLAGVGIMTGLAGYKHKPGRPDSLAV
jgi:hypothetical protein